MAKPFIVGTSNARDMLPRGLEILRRGGSAMDAVEETIRAVEENPLDTGVGLGGIPNLLGIPQLDASIMDGRTLRAGAVAAVEGYLHPISIARKVLEVSPHVLLVGRGAELFAEAMGFKRQELLTERSLKVYRAFLEDALGGLDESFGDARAYWTDYVRIFKLRDWYMKLSDIYHGTVNVMAMDGNGDICSGVSTSGTALKLPGRVGDSPIIGAGNYCDNRVGAAACTGRGELSIRLSTARSIIFYMENGMSVQEACVRAMREALALGEYGGLSCLAFDKDGNTMSASISREPIYYYMDVDSEEPEQRRGVWVRAEGGLSHRGYDPRLITRNVYGERRPVLGEVVAILHITFEKRGLKLIEAMSRALLQGEIHELMITDEEPTLGGTVDRVSAIAFFEVKSGGVIVVGDEVTLDGRPLGTLGGFDLTHMPNHMNILIRSNSLEAPRVNLGDLVIFHGSRTAH